jgi:phage shock protein E
MRGIFGRRRAMRWAVLPLVCLSMTLTSCTYSAEERWARSALVHKMDQGALIVDVRTPEEYRSGHIKGAVNVPHTEVRGRISEFGEDPARPIVVYCGKGGRAETARMVLEEEGFTNVWNLGNYSNLAQVGPHVISGS